MKKPKQRGQRYLEAKKLLEKNKLYPLSEAIKLLKKVSISSFNSSIDAHLNTYRAGLKGEVEFPYKTGKTFKVAIADEAVLAKIVKGKIDFNLLLATPAMMSKLTKYAKVLGPKGLMPNPKAGTISNNPQALAKKLGTKIPFKTEPEAPLIHLTIGKINDEPKSLKANFLALVKTIGLKNIRSAVLAPTMGPGIKIKLDKYGNFKK